MTGGVTEVPYDDAHGVERAPARGGPPVSATPVGPGARELATALSGLSGLSGSSAGERGSGGVLVDLSGDGATAEVAARLGLRYLGVRTPRDAPHLVARADDDVVAADLSDPAALASPLTGACRGRRVAAVYVGDVLNRTEDLRRYLASLQALCRELGDPPVVVAASNVTHLDVAAKLLIGRWDVTDSGTLAATYVHHYSASSLRSVMAAAGWREVEVADVPGADSDQHFPPDAATLEPTTPVGALLRRLRETAAPDARAARLVRSYARGDVDGAATGAGERDERDGAEDVDPTTPFLSVLLRTQGRREATLQEALLCLAAQTCDDFEVLVLLHDGDAAALGSLQSLVSVHHRSFSGRVRVVPVSGGGRCRPLNEGALLARGRYVAMLDDDDLVLANWVETFRDAAARFPAHVVRTAVATQRVESRDGQWEGRHGYEVVDRPRLVFALDFDHVDHILDNRTPNNGYAFPRSLVTDLGVRWDESLPVLEDWDHLLACASICGVAGVPEITAILRWWDVGEDSKSTHAPELWATTRRRVVEKHDASPLLLDRGAFSRLRTRLIDGDVAAERAAGLERELGALRQRLESADLSIGAMATALDSRTAELAEIHASRSWRATAALRLAAAAARKARRKR